MGKIKDITGRLFYGLLFVVILPALLVIWTRATNGIISLPVPENTLYGYILFFAGTGFVFSGMLNLWNLGKGLPMNAFPPERFVKGGIYSLIRHPIYSGAVLISFGLSIISHSASGLWLVSPVFILLITAYVTGFENERIVATFGKQDYRPFLSLPYHTEDKPVFYERLSSYFLVFIPWLLVYEVFIYTGIPANAIVTNLSFEQKLPVWEFSEIFYSFTYLFALLVPLVIRSKKELRNFIADLWFATILAGMIYFLFPFIVNQKEFVPRTFLGRLIIFERLKDGVTCALPSFHVIWAFIAARYFSRTYISLKWSWYVLAVIISVSCITTGMHSVPDVIAGFLIFLIIIYRQNIWNFIRLQSEHLSNSWKEWRFGPVRVINHGFYGGAAGFAGTLIAGYFNEPQTALAIFAVMIFVIIGAGLWAQIIEGSPKLLRPYGYYGGLAGGIIASGFICLLFSIDFFKLIASFAMAAPWIQSIGRLRCLVQGCCHGKPSNESIGIRFTHPLSRVNKISGLKGVPLHPTQLYSIGTNIITGLVLIRLYSLGMSASFITGIYFIFNGTGRFVEESFRGEAQTPYWVGMRIYQWIAIINILAGAVFTSIPNTGNIVFQPNVISLILAAGIGILVTIASGVDFPESNSRFARLTSN
jgi:protein-S-isoprenylcysteine O-methyltransferase Ste14/membrane-associated phospholipid phosphatase